jgi:hypothetical protein
MGGSAVLAMDSALADRSADRSYHRPVAVPTLQQGSECFLTWGAAGISLGQFPRAQEADCGQDCGCVVGRTSPAVMERFTTIMVASMHHQTTDPKGLTRAYQGGSTRNGFRNAQ